LSEKVTHRWTGNAAGVWEDGNYTKPDVGDAEMAGWRRCEAVGVTPSFTTSLVVFNGVNKYTVTCRGGHTIRDVLEKQMVGPAGLQAIAAAVRDVQQALKSGGIAQCDIRLRTMVVSWGKSDLSDPVVTLVECNDAVPFGEPRRVVSPGYNGDKSDLGRPTSAATDTVGFDWVLTALIQGH
jgi:hypothetical protein